MEPTAMDRQKIDAETAQLVADTLKLTAESAKLTAESAKLTAEGGKYRRETEYYPFVAGAAAMGACIALVKIFL